MGLLLTWVRFAGLATVDLTQPSATIARVMTDHRDDARLANNCGLAGAFLLLWFVGYLYRHI